MATFTVQIDEQLIQYLSSNEDVVSENCTTTLNTYSVGLQRLVADPTSLFLIDKYKGQPWEYLFITNMVYTDEAVCYLEYLGTPVVSGTAITQIDITALAIGDVIPGLVIKSNITKRELISRFITFDYKISELNGLVPLYRTTVIESAVVSCTTPFETEVTDIINGVSSCGSVDKNFTVLVNEGYPINFRYKTTANGSLLYDFTAPIDTLDTSNGTAIDNVTYMSSIEDVFYNVTYYPQDGANEVYFRTSLCSSSPTATTATVVVEVLSNDKTIVIETFNLSHIV